jgi:hypothetical protein
MNLSSSVRFLVANSTTLTIETWFSPCWQSPSRTHVSLSKDCTSGPSRTGNYKDHLRIANWFMAISINIALTRKAGSITHAAKWSNLPASQNVIRGGRSRTSQLHWLLKKKASWQSIVRRTGVQCRKRSADPLLEVAKYFTTSVFADTISGNPSVTRHVPRHQISVRKVAGKRPLNDAISIALNFMPPCP